MNLNYKPEVLVNTEELTEKEWLDYRQKGIGGSDAAAALGLSPFTTKRDLYYDKLNIQPVIDEEDNWVAKEVGHRLEDLVAKIFSKKMGLYVYPIRKMFKHPLFPFMLADIDFMVDLPDGTKAILETKTTNYNCQDKWFDDSVPINYETQCRHYMAVLNIDKAFVACLYGNNENEFFIRSIERDLDIERDLIAEEEFFWNEQVKKRIEPPYTEKPDLVLVSIRKHYGPAEQDADVVNLKKDYISNLTKYFEVKEKKSDIEKKLKQLESEIKSCYLDIVADLGTSCKGIISNGLEEYKVSYNPIYRTFIDKKGLEKLKINHPDIYDEYVQTSESRRFSVKGSKSA